MKIINFGRRKVMNSVGHRPTLVAFDQAQHVNLKLQLVWFAARFMNTFDGNLFTRSSIGGLHHDTECAHA